MSQMNRRQFGRSGLAGLAFFGGAARAFGAPAGVPVQQAINGGTFGPRYIHLDVFTDRRFEGNQLAVFPEAAGLSDATIQAIAREMNFAESTFIMAAETPGISSSRACVSIMASSGA
mgnify:CR=1 FL=1